MPEMDLSGLTHCRLRCALRAERGAILPPFLGSTLRGAIAMALKRRDCQHWGDPCPGCSHGTTCSYAALFEPSPPPDAERLRSQRELCRPIVFEPPPERAEPYAAGELLRFDLLLFGAAAAQLPALVPAIEAAASSGLGARRSPFSLDSLRLVAAEGAETPLWQPGQGPVPLPPTRPVVEPGALPVAPGAVHLELQRPTRIQRDGRLLKTIDLRTFARTLLGRLSCLAYFHCGFELDLDFRSLLDAASACEQTEHDLHLVDLSRFSNTQGRGVRLDGMVGHLAWRGPAIAPLAPALLAGQVTHLGKGCVFGLGQYRVVGWG